jgi:hypothetical protein
MDLRFQRCSVPEEVGYAPHTLFRLSAAFNAHTRALVWWFSSTNVSFNLRRRKYPPLLFLPPQAEGNFPHSQVVKIYFLLKTKRTMRLATLKPP